MVKKKYTPSELEEQTLEKFKDKIENSRKEILSQEDYDNFTDEIGLVIENWYKTHNSNTLLFSAFQFLFYQICIHIHNSGESEAAKRTTLHSFVDKLVSILERAFQEAKEHAEKSTWN